MNINMPLTPTALKEYSGICENDKYIIGLANFGIATILPGQAMQNAITLYTFIQNKEMILTSDWPVNISMFLTHMLVQTIKTILGSVLQLTIL